MADTGWLNFSTFANDATLGTIAWTNPSNAQTSNDVRANVILTNDQSNRLKCTSPSGVSIPSGSVIDGVEFRAELSCSSGVQPIGIFGAELFKNVYENSYNLAPSATTTDTYYIFGGPKELFGATLNSSDFGTNFGVGIRIFFVQGYPIGFYIDHVQVKIYYGPGMFFAV